jgi:magnesium-transporting ATPase (P-type)
MRNGVFKQVPWRSVRVGDIMKIQRNETVPADCVFLSSFSPDAETPDTCYVQTAQLDGETNLKLKQAVAASVSRFRSDEDCARFKGFVRCEPPNAAFDKFIGTLFLQPPSPQVLAPAMANATRGVSSADAIVGKAIRHAVRRIPERPVPLEAEQVLLRGSVLRNVDYAYALAAYTGRETKVRVRQTSRVLKRAQVEKDINRLIVVLVALLIAFCVSGAVGAAIWSGRHEGDRYLESGPFSVADGIRTVFTFFLLNAAFVPVSLYVTVRLARSFQMLLMEADLKMVHKDEALVQASGGLEGSYPFRVRTMDLNDELGQITHVFSDKTGTLTLNYMEFRKLSVHGVAYGLGTTQIGIDRMRREGLDTAVAIAQLEAEKNQDPKDVCSLPHVNFTDGSETHPGRSMANDARNPSDGDQGTAIFQLLLHLALNHTVLTEVVRGSGGEMLGERLSASSPDEEAFLYASEFLGYKFLGRTHETVTIACKFPASLLPLPRYPPPARPEPASDAEDCSLSPPRTVPPRKVGSKAQGGCEITFRILHILAYSQERKRMSVIVESPMYDPTTDEVLACTGHGDLYLFCKGADSVIFPRLRLAGQSPRENRMRRHTKRQLIEWGNDGLRTLVFASRRLDLADFCTWSNRFQSVCVDMEEIRKRKMKQPNSIDDMMNEVENGLSLQGATANEDKLQPEVPETIELLGRAGVRVWMVTGDKQETAVNIGYATRLLDDSMRQIVATVDSAGDVKQAVKRIRVAAKRMRAEKKKDAESCATARSNIENVVEWVNRSLVTLEAKMGFAVHEGDHSEIPEPQHQPGDIDAPRDLAKPSEGVALPKFMSKAWNAFESRSRAGTAMGIAVGSNPTSTMGVSQAIPPGLPPEEIKKVLDLIGIQPDQDMDDEEEDGDTNKGGDAGGLQPASGSNPIRSRSASFDSEDGEMEDAGDLDKPFVAPTQNCESSSGALAELGESSSNLLGPSSGGSASGASADPSVAPAAHGPVDPDKPSRGRDPTVRLADDPSGSLARSGSSSSRAAAAKAWPSPARSPEVPGVETVVHALGSAPALEDVTGLVSTASYGILSGTPSDSPNNPGRIAVSLTPTPGSEQTPASGVTVSSGTSFPLTSTPLASSADASSAATAINAPDVSIPIDSTNTHAQVSSELAVIGTAPDAGDSHVRRASASQSALANRHSQSMTSPSPAAAKDESHRVNTSTMNHHSASAAALVPPEIVAKLAAPVIGSQRRPYALVIDEHALDAALSHAKTRAYLLFVAVNCSAVICCRARPDQKARVVKLIREGVPSSRTLAIGDGANDVDMIRQAHVGVGIAGAEGVQAANASDYSIGRFKFLQRLLLVHGRWNYLRMIRTVLYIFYKNIIFVCTQFWFTTQVGFSGQKFYVEYGNQTFNLLFTGLPILLLGVYDYDIFQENALKYPKLFDYGRTGKGLNIRVFLSWIAAAIFESLVIFFFSLAAYRQPDSMGDTAAVFQLGTVPFSCVIAVVSMRIACEMNSHHWWFQFFTFGSAIIWVPCCFVFDWMNSDGFEGGMTHVFGSAVTWFTIGLVLTVCAVRTMGWKAWKRAFQPKFPQIVQEAQLSGDFSSVDAYSDAADLARKTGKTIREVYEAADIAETAAAVIASRVTEARAYTVADAGQTTVEDGTAGLPDLRPGTPAGHLSRPGTAGQLKKSSEDVGREVGGSVGAYDKGPSTSASDVYVGKMPDNISSLLIPGSRVSPRRKSYATPFQGLNGMPVQDQLAESDAAGRTKSQPEISTAEERYEEMLSARTPARRRHGHGSSSSLLSGYTIATPAINKDFLERALIARPRVDSEAVAQYDPSADFDHEQDNEQGIFHTRYSLPAEEAPSSFTTPSSAGPVSGTNATGSDSTAQSSRHVKARKVDKQESDSIFQEASKAGLRIPKDSGSWRTPKGHSRKMARTQIGLGMSLGALAEDDADDQPLSPAGPRSGSQGPSRQERSASRVMSRGVDDSVIIRGQFSPAYAGSRSASTSIDPFAAHFSALGPRVTFSPSPGGEAASPTSSPAHPNPKPLMLRSSSAGI